MANFTKIIIVFQILFISGAFVRPIFAHEFASESGKSFTFHVEPGDKPTQGVLTNMSLVISDTSHELVQKDGKLNCICELSIRKDEEVEQAYAILNIGQLSQVPYTFHKKGEYSVVFSVQPKNGQTTPGSFEKAFPVFVQSSSPLWEQIQNWIFNSIVIIFLIGVVAVIVQNKKAARKK